MKTSEIFKKKTAYTFEVFPPKKTSPIETVFTALDELRDQNPDFISVTFGAGGTQNSDNTLAIADRIKNVCKVESVVHLPCLYLTKEIAADFLTKFRHAGIENILALRGDLVDGIDACGDFMHASELIQFIKEFDSKDPEGKSFDIIAACYPEGHPAATSYADDIKHLKEKVDCGASHLISQLFFDNEVFYKFLDDAKNAGISVPIEAGIMPVVNRKQIERMVDKCGVVLPKKYVKMMEKYGDNNEAIRDAGIAYAIDQIVDLVSHGVDGIHLYTMNNPYIARKITEATKSLF
ncbi:MAG: methylenetetrahydrofolate reductase [NAD(P)H] [Treponemataceae bacterium]|nr:methylenetetrahydrofolate reductase [NAD(P)H] [Treponemataceae bacterium]